jgi:hypothetical protein
VPQEKAQLAWGLKPKVEDRFSEVSAMPPAGRFEGLEDTDRQVLERWLAGVSHLGIDAAIDLSSRPWNLPASCVIIGVFKRGAKVASWLLVGDGLGWTLVNCATNDIAGAADTLASALALIET